MKVFLFLLISTLIISCSSHRESITFSGDVDYKYMVEQLDAYDVKWNIQTDIIYITKSGDYYIIESKNCDYPIATLTSKREVYLLLQWIGLYPPSTDSELEHSQQYYQVIVHEKI